MGERLPPNDGPGRERDARNTYVAFAGLWAVAILFHVASFSLWDASFYYLALVAAALGLLARPASVPRLALLALLQVYEFADRAPFASNHSQAMAVANLTILAALLLTVARERSFSVSGSSLLRAFAPVLRVELLVLYFYVVFHKLNVDFFSPEFSCARDFYVNVGNVFGIRAALVPGPQLAPWVTVGTEAAIPLLLLFRRTRAAGILLGGAFHALIVLNPAAPAYNFSALLYARYVLFAPENLVTRVREHFRRSRPRAWARRIAEAPFSEANLARWIAAGFAGLLLLTLLSAWPPASLSLPRNSRGFFMLLWLIYAPGLLLVFAATCWRERGALRPVGRAFRPLHPSLLAFPVLFFVSGASPYLGLKTEQSFAMYSNLRTEGNRTNHLLVPTATQVFGFQRDMVTVLSSSNGGLARLTAESEAIPFFELLRRAPHAADDAITFVRNGELIEIARIGDRPELLVGPSFLQFKLLSFRTVDRRRGQACRH